MSREIPKHIPSEDQEHLREALACVERHKRRKKAVEDGLRKEREQQDNFKRGKLSPSK